MWLSSSLLSVSQDKNQSVTRSGLLLEVLGEILLPGLFKLLVESTFFVIASPVSLLAVIWVPPLAPEAPLWLLVIGPQSQAHPIHLCTAICRTHIINFPNFLF